MSNDKIEIPRAPGITGEYHDRIEALIKNPIMRMTVRMIFSIKEYVESVGNISLDAPYSDIFADFVKSKRNREDGCFDCFGECVGCLHAGEPTAHDCGGCSHVCCGFCKVRRETYRVDPDRCREAPHAIILPHNTGIVVRAVNADGQWDGYDIAALDRDSLLRWLCSRDGNNLLAENVVLKLLGHETEIRDDAS